MTKSAQQIVDDIAEYVSNDRYSTWYAGIAADPRDALFSRHGVSEKEDRWIYRGAVNSESARVAESALHDGGFDGGPGGGDASTKYVYAYKKAAHTSEK